MRIVLIGEYSRLHNSLKEGLESLGHSVLLIGTGDGFKKFPVDVDIHSRYFSKGVLHIFRMLIYKICRLDLAAMERGLRAYLAIRKIENGDIVQLINEKSMHVGTRFEIFLIKKLKKKHKKLFLLSCGTDYKSVLYAYQKKFKYSLFTPYFDGVAKADPRYKVILEKLSASQKKIHTFLYENVDGVIASDIDYHIPLLGEKKYKGLIPNPINIDKLTFETHDVSEKITIFHGINASNFHTKGNYIMEKALDVIKAKYPKRVAVISTVDLPYAAYIAAYSKCNIVMDQVFSYDQGYNALESMARGKVVFTGAEQAFLDHYKLEKNQVCINAVPEVYSIVKELETLIEAPEKIHTIGKSARDFVLHNHHYVEVAKKYVQVWTSEETKA